MTAPTPRSATAVRTFAQGFSPTARGARLARLLAVEQLRTWRLPPELVDRAEHVVAELAANAAQHGSTTGVDFELALTLGSAPGRLRIAVTDSLPGQPVASPVPSCPTAESGRGLLLVTALADRWGIVVVPPAHKTVWAEIDRVR